MESSVNGKADAGTEIVSGTYADNQLTLNKQNGNTVDIPFEEIDKVYRITGQISFVISSEYTSSSTYAYFFKNINDIYLQNNFAPIYTSKLATQGNSQTSSYDRSKLDYATYSSDIQSELRREFVGFPDGRYYVSYGMEIYTSLTNLDFTISNGTLNLNSGSVYITYYNTLGPDIGDTVTQTIVSISRM